MTPKHAASEQPAGSPPSGEPVFLVIGKLRRPHGLRGEMIMEVQTDFPERIQTGMHVFAGETKQSLEIRSLRPHKDNLLVAFHGLNTLEAVGVLRNQEIFVRADQVPRLEEGEYYHHEIIGLRVFLENGQSIGEVTEILETGANDVLVVKRPGAQELLLPLIDEVVLSIDLAAGSVLVNLLPGLE